MLRVNVTEMEAIFTTVESEVVSLLIRQLLFSQKSQTLTQIGVVPNSRSLCPAPTLQFRPRPPWFYYFPVVI